MIGAGFVHQMPRRCPVAVTIEQCADHAAVEHTGKRFVLLLWHPIGDNLVTFGETADAHAFSVSRSAAVARVFRRVFFLKRLLHATMRRRRDTAATVVRCKANAAGSSDCDRAAR